MSKHLPKPVRKSATQRRGAATYNKGYEAGYAQCLTDTGRAKPPLQYYACELCACTAGDEDGCLHPAEDIFEMRMGLRLCRHHVMEVGGGDLSRPLSRRISRCNPHPDDDAIDQFALGMKMKMAVSRAKGRAGWQDVKQCSAEGLSGLLYEHVRKGDPIDVANFCMMLSMRGERIVEAGGDAPTILSITPQANELVKDRNVFAGKYRSIIALMNRARQQLQEIFDHIDDEGDRAYLGSTNHRDWLRSMLDDMDRWSFDATLPKGDINKMDADPYAEIRAQRARAEEAEVQLRKLQDWRPIAEADKGIAYHHQVAELKIGASHPTWVRDADGRAYEAIWSDDGKRTYWWDLEGESPVNPVEFMPHPLSRAATPTSGAEHAD